MADRGYPGSSTSSSSKDSSRLFAPQPYRRRGKGRSRQQNGSNRRGQREGSGSDEEALDGPSARAQQEKLKDLLVFGYASRIFRDNEKALQMEKNLIPWADDRSNMIDSLLRDWIRGSMADIRVRQEQTAELGRMEKALWSPVDFGALRREAKLAGLVGLVSFRGLRIAGRCYGLENEGWTLWNDEIAVDLDYVTLTYDCRGHLHNLTEFDAHTAASWVAPQPDEEEVKLENLCQQERYRDLLQIQREKRRVQAEERQKVMENEYLQAIAPPSPARDEPVIHSDGTHAAIPFSYGAVSPPPPPPPTAEATGTKVPSTEKPTESVQATVVLPKQLDGCVDKRKKKGEFESFTPRPEFDIPSHICLPQYKRLNSIMERTANFVAEKGSQLEVVIRAKQAGNPSFSFLNAGDVLYPYFRYLVDAIKKGAFKPPPESSSSSSSESETDSEDGDYLHPSLLRRSAAPAPVAAASRPSTSVFSEPSSFSTLYGSLINKVQLVTGHATAPPSTNGRPTPEVLSAMEKMAAYVVKNGQQFESMIQARHGQDDAKFGFIHGYHPYHSLYDEMKRNLRQEALEEKLAEEEMERERPGGYHAVAPPSADTLAARLPSPPPPPPPPPPEPPQEDPRIAESKRKALEASLRIAEKLKERQSTVEAAKAASSSLPPPILFTVKSVTKERESSVTDLDDLLEESLAKDREKERTKLVNSETSTTPGSLLELLKEDEIRLLKEKAKLRKNRRKDVDEDDDELLHKVSKKKRRRSPSQEDRHQRDRSKKGKTKKRSRSKSREKHKHHKKRRSSSRSRSGR